jgi:hypothetical protein
VGLATGPVSFQRFFITGPAPAELTDTLAAAIVEHGFGRLATLPDDTQLGWVGPSHVFDTQLAAERIALGSFVHLALRVDRLRPPASVLRGYVRMAEEAALQASGREYLSKLERRKAREVAAQRAEQEARDGAFRRISAYPVLVDLAGGAVYLGSAGASTADRLMKLFSDTFGAGLEPADPQRLALRLLAPSGRARALENLAPAQLVRPPDGYQESAAAAFAVGDLAFLGRELLSWLWFRSDSDEAVLRVRNGAQVSAAIDRGLRLKCVFDLTGTTTVVADGPTRLPECKAALRIGKQPVRAGLVLDGPGGEVRLTLDGVRLSVSGLQLPEPQGVSSERERLEQRFEQIVETATLLDALFELFLLQRTAGDWPEELQRMSAWATGLPRDRRLQAASA